MKTFIAVIAVNDDERPGSPVAAAIQQGYGDEYVTAYLRTKMPAGSPLHVVSAHEVGVETVLSDGEANVLLNPTRPIRDDDPVHP